MSFSIGKKAILTDLVLNLDASNRVSYPGIGGSWYDISGYGNHFSLLNSPTWTGNAFTFNANGGNQYAQCINNTCGNFGSSSFTIEYVTSVGLTSNATEAVLKKRGQVTNLGASGNNGWLDRNNNGIYVQDNAGIGTPSNNFNQSIQLLPITPLDNLIYHNVFTINRIGQKEVSGSLYRNGIKVGSDDCMFTASAAGGDGLVDNASYLYAYSSTTGSFYLFRIYNRVLTASEVQSNYQSIRSKLGI